MSNNSSSDPILTTLIAAHALLAPGPERWTQMHIARDIDGIPVDIGSFGAVCFCISGAVEKASSSTNNWVETLRYIRRIIGRTVVGFNDSPTTTYEMVMDVLTRSIATRGAEVGGV